MRKKIIILSVSLIALIFGYVSLRESNSYHGDLKSSEAVESFNDFIDSHKKKIVTLSIMIDDTMMQEIEEGMKRGPTFFFHASSPEQPEKKIKYVFKTPEDGTKLFNIDKENRKFEGDFIVQKILTPEGETIVRLIPLPHKINKK